MYGHCGMRGSQASVYAQPIAVVRQVAGWESDGASG
jgi:hypothetical protein